MMPNSENKKYFPNLNGLRFIAALLVVINHIEVAKYYAGYDNYMRFPFFTAIGNLSVTCFFVLSGFLITHLLLQEKRNSNTINIQFFYLKRILRIWPVYFLLIAVSLIVIYNADFFHLKLPKEVHLKNTFGTIEIILLVVVPNVITTFYYFPYLFHIWSIGMEEQFYLIWPWIMKHTKNYLKVFLILLIIAFVFSLLLYLVKTNTEDVYIIKNIKYIKDCFDRSRIVCMAIGGIGAWLIFNKKEKILSILYKKEIQWITIFLIILLYITGYSFPFIKHELYSILFCILIVNLSTNSKSVLRLENKTFHFLGKISYGIYMFHPLIIAFCILLLQQIKSFVFGKPLSDLLLYCFSISLTIAISSISYYRFEKYFLKLKEQITKDSK